MGYNANRNNNRRNNGRNFNNKRNDDRYEERKKRNEERAAKQRRDLDSIIAICSYLNDDISSDREEGARVSYKVNDIIDKASKRSNIDADNFKFVSQYSYIIADLAGAHFDTRVTVDQLAIKIRYIADRLYLGFMRSFHDEIGQLLTSNIFLFGIPTEDVEEAEATEQQEAATEGETVESAPTTEEA